MKIKQKRKPMTAEQKEAAVERLKKARAAKGEPKNLSIDESIRNLPDDHFLSPVKVKEWLVIWKGKLAGMKSLKDSKQSSDRALYQQTETYCKNLQTYLSTGTWNDWRYGENMEFKIGYRSVAVAYKNGIPVRTPGVYYPETKEEMDGD
jgi:hypothetical protein